MFQFANHVSYGCNNRRYGQCQSFESATSVLAVTNMMKARIPNGFRLFNAVKLSAVVGDERIVLSASSIRKKKPILLTFPTQLLDVVNCVLPEQVSYGLHKLERYVLVEQQAHAVSRSNVVSVLVPVDFEI